MLRSIERRRECGDDGRARAVREARETKSDDAEGKRRDAHGEKRRGGGEDRYDVRQNHRILSARVIEKRAGENSADAVEHSKNADERRGKFGSPADGQNEITGKADDRRADRRQENETHERAPVGEALHHLRRSVILRLKIFFFETLFYIFLILGLYK